MKSVIRTIVTGLVFAGFVTAAAAQTGKPVTIVDANAVTAAELAKLPHMNPELAKAVISKRPFKTALELDKALSSLSKEQRTELYGKLFVALLTEKLIAHARAFSPWGYDLPAETKSVA